MSTLTNTDDCLSVYSLDAFDDAAPNMIDQAHAVRTPPASNIQFKMRQGANTAQQIEQW